MSLKLSSSDLTEFVSLRHIVVEDIVKVWLQNIYFKLDTVLGDA